MSAMEHEPRSTNDGDHENARQNHQKKRNMSGSAPLHRFARPIILRSHRTNSLNVRTRAVDRPKPDLDWSLDRLGLYGCQPLHR
jgi:hypothetical protein